MYYIVLDQLLEASYQALVSWVFIGANLQEDIHKVADRSRSTREANTENPDSLRLPKDCTAELDWYHTNESDVHAHAHTIIRNRAPNSCS